MINDKDGMFPCKQSFLRDGCSSWYKSPQCRGYVINAAIGHGNSVNPYSLGLMVSLAGGTGLSTFNGDAKIDAVAVPEPASAVLLIGVLLFAASGLRRRMRKA